MGAAFRECPGMNRTRVVLGTLLLFLLAAPFCHAQGNKSGKAPDPRLTRTFTATKTLKLDAAVADFVIELIHKNTAGVQDRYRKLTAKTEEEAGGRYLTRRFEAIQWFVNEYAISPHSKGAEHTYDYTYLARQQLISGFHHGFSATVNVVGQVRVLTWHYSLHGKGKGPKTKPGWLAPGTKVTLTFEGFLDSVPVRSPE